MTGKRIKNEQWEVKHLVNKIKQGEIIKPKFQRKKKWDILPKKTISPNEKDYINFLYETFNSVHAITFGENLSNGPQTYTNIDGNNRINAICHFMERPFDIYSEYLNDLFTFIDENIKDKEINKKIKNIFLNISYNNLMLFKYNKFFIDNGEEELYKNHLQKLRDYAEPIIEEIQNKLMINRSDRFDTNVKINVNLFEGYSTEELCKIFEDINKFNTKLAEIELLACRLYNVKNFNIIDKVLYANILNTLEKFYKNKAENEVLTCYNFEVNDSINAYDFIVGFQNYCNIQCSMIEQTDSDGLSLFFKVYKTLFKSTFENSFTTENVNFFIEKMKNTISILNKIKNNIFTENINETLFNKTCNEKINTLKKNNMYLIIVAIIGFLNINEDEKVIIKSIEKTLLYHFFVQDISNKDKREDFKNMDFIIYEAGGSFIDSQADKLYKNPYILTEKLKDDVFSSLCKVLFEEGNSPYVRFLENGNIKKDKRRGRKFFEKTLLFYYYKQNVPTNLLENKYSLEHICPFSSSWDEEIDIDRLGNVIPILDTLNTKRNNRSISVYYEQPQYNDFIQYISKIMPTIEKYNELVSYNATKKPIINNNNKYNILCEKNEQIYFDNFMKCISNKT